MKVAIETAVRSGWDGVIGADGMFVGMNWFGASAPHKDRYRHRTGSQNAQSVRRHLRQPRTARRRQ
jgi:transketolase